LADAARASAGEFDNPQMAEMTAWALEQYELGNKDSLKFIKAMNTIPVPIEEFLDSPDFMGATDLQLWPEVRKCIIESCKYWWKGLGNGAVKEILLTGATGCVDWETEFLTRKGWKHISQYEEGDAVLQYNEDGTANWVQPSEYHKKPAGFFYKFKNKTVDQMLTPGHRMILRIPDTGVIVERSAEEVATAHNARTHGFSLGKFISAYNLEEGVGVDLTDPEIKLMVAATSMGKNLRRRSSVVTCRINSDDKANQLLALLRELSIPHNATVGVTNVHHVSFTAPQRINYYADWYQPSKRQMQLIANEMLKWTGVEGKNRLYMNNADTADYTQFIFTGLGQRASITLIERNGEAEWVEYCVNLCASQDTGLKSTNKSHASKVSAFVAKCYCFTVPSGMWVMRRGGKVAVTGNTGKSEIAKVVTAYHLHIIGCMKSVQAYFGLPSQTGVSFPIQAAKPHVTKKVIYAPLRGYIEHMPWFRRHMRPNKLIESQMFFEKQNIWVVPGGSESDAILGEAIIGGIVDEINFMNVVQNSKKAELEGGRSGTYDQAQSVYDALTKRRKGRFITRGPHIGIFCFSSSRRYRGDFTDRRQAYVEESGEEGVIIYDKAQYEARPASLYCGEKFRVCLMNDAMGDIRILEHEEEHEPRGATVFWVPIEYLEDFKKDPAGSTRDIIGRSTHAIAPFFRKRTVIADFFDRGRESGLTSILHKDNVVLGLEGMPRVRREMYCRDPSRPRYVHIDLSQNGDRCGIAMVRYNGMVEKERRSGISERLPSASVEMACSIEPDHASEIDLAEVRTWVKQLKDVYGYPIKSVSYDGWNCIADDTMVWTGRGMLKASEVRVGDIVQSR